MGILLFLVIVMIDICLYLIASYPVDAILNCVTIKQEDNFMFITILLLAFTELVGYTNRQLQIFDFDLLVELLTTISHPYNCL